MSSILFNIPSLISQSKLRVHVRDTERAMERLATGQRINRAADDPVGCTVSENMRSQLRGMTMASRNASEGAALLQIAEGACGEITTMLQRMRELAVQSSNDTLTSTERQYAQIEFAGLRQEINRISGGTQYNGKNLLDGSSLSFSSLSQSGVLHFGANNQEYEDYTEVNMAPVTSTTLGLDGSSVSTQAGSLAALAELDSALETLGAQRSKMGALVNRMDRAVENLSLKSNDLQTVESQIRDADFAKETTQMTLNQILQQSSIAMLAQANSQPQSVLELFR